MHTARAVYELARGGVHPARPTFCPVDQLRTPRRPAQLVYRA